MIEQITYIEKSFKSNPTERTRAGQYFGECCLESRGVMC